MGRKKKKATRRPNDDQAPNQAAAGDESDDDVDVDNPNSAMMEQQRRLLEKFKSEARPHDSSAATSDAARNSKEPPPHVEEQRLLLEKFKSEARPDDSSVAASEAARNSTEPLAPPHLEQQRKLLEEASEAARDSKKPPPHVEHQRMLLEKFKSEARTDSSSAAASEAARNSKEPPPPLPEGCVSELYVVRRVQFQGRDVPVLLQSRFGPCALLAVANCLLLRGTLELAQDETFVSSEALVDRLGRLCERLNGKAAEKDENLRGILTELRGRLPFLLDGLLVNCNFSGCQDFECCADLSLFDVLGLQLYHAWVDPEAHKLVGGYNMLVERLAVSAEIRLRLERDGQAPEEVEEARLTEAVWLEQFHEDTRMQATAEGMVQLMDRVKQGGVCVLFRNNHFSTMYRPQEGMLCTLVTDAVFEDVATAVWEPVSLNSCTGFLSSDFTPTEEAEVDASQGGRGKASAARAAARAPKSGPDSASREALVRIVLDMGFTREQAVAGLESVEWRGAEEAVDAILTAAATGSLPKRATTSEGGPPFRCPRCRKEFNSQNGMLSHRAAKQH